MAGLLYKKRFGINNHDGINSSFKQGRRHLRDQGRRSPTSMSGLKNVQKFQF